MKKACWILFGCACGIAVASMHRPLPLIFEDLTIFMLGIWFGLILAFAYPAK